MVNYTDAVTIRVGPGMAKSSKLFAARKGRVLLVRRRRDRLWMFPGGRRRAGESERKCLRREIGEELPHLKVGTVRLWKEVKEEPPIRTTDKWCDLRGQEGLRPLEDRRQAGNRQGQCGGSPVA